MWLLTNRFSYEALQVYNAIIRTAGASGRNSRRDGLVAYDALHFDQHSSQSGATLALNHFQNRTYVALFVVWPDMRGVFFHARCVTGTHRTICVVNGRRRSISCTVDVGPIDPIHRRPSEALVA